MSYKGFKEELLGNLASAISAGVAISFLIVALAIGWGVFLGIVALIARIGR